jgi:hypothetical protein
MVMLVLNVTLILVEVFIILSVRLVKVFPIILTLIAVITFALIVLKNEISANVTNNTTLLLIFLVKEINLLV